MKKCKRCKVAEGQEHILGCSYEECPFCNRTLYNCSCFTDMLSIEGLITKKHQNFWLKKLNEIGRIKFGQENFAGKEKEEIERTLKKFFDMNYLIAGDKRLMKVVFAAFLRGWRIGQDTTNLEEAEIYWNKLEKKYFKNRENI